MDSMRDMFLNLWSRSPRATERRLQRDLDAHTNKVVDFLVSELTTHPEHFHKYHYGKGIHNGEWLVRLDYERNPVKLDHVTRFSQDKRVESITVFQHETDIPLSRWNARKLRRAALQWEDQMKRRASLVTKIEALEQLSVLTQNLPSTKEK